MQRWRTTVAMGCVAGLLLSAAPLICAQSAATWQAQQAAALAKSDQIMANVRVHKGLLAQYMAMRAAYARDNSPAFRLIFGQYVSWYQSFIGDYPAAVRSFSIAQPPSADDKPSPLAGGDYAARPAVEAIPDLARHYRIVLFNEAHNVVLTRSLIVQMLAPLYAEGFRYFAAETLVQSDTALQQRGYPTQDSGFYTEEPIYAETVRTALKLGFKVIAYEASDDTQGADARETEQARQLYERVFAHDPQARLVVQAGYGHILTTGAYLGGKSMAEHLYQLTHLPMLSVEQIMMYPHPSTAQDHPYYTEVMKRLHPDTPIVFVTPAGQPWALKTGYSVSVFFPLEKLERGRPTWLSLGGLRHPHLVTADNCEAQYPCLVEAHYSNEGPDAIPADRVLLDQPPLAVTGPMAVYSGVQDMPWSELYLRPGRYQVSYTVRGDRVLRRETVIQP